MSQLDVDLTVLEGLWVRHARDPRTPLPDRNPPPNSRWQRGAVVDALYLADSEATAWAEWYRYLAESGIPPQQLLPTYLWTWRVDVGVANLQSSARLKRVGLPRPKPGRATWPLFQAVGEALYREGWSGLIAPSAARPKGRVLCLFRESGKRLTGATPMRPAREILMVPVPPTGMIT